MQPNLGAETNVPGSRDERVWEQMRPRLPPDSLTGIGSRRIDLKALEADCNAERMASALESRALKIQRKSSLAVAPSQRKFALRGHNHLLRRQHCSSLCSQSEGHEHVANMTNTLGDDFVGFSARAWPPQYSPPHFASKVSYSASPQTLAECSRSASCCYATTFVWILNTMHKILPANGKITDCLIIERSFFHRIVCFRQCNSSCALCEHVL